MFNILKYNTISYETENPLVTKCPLGHSYRSTCISAEYCSLVYSYIFILNLKPIINNRIP